MEATQHVPGVLPASKAAYIGYKVLKLKKKEKIGYPLRIKQCPGLLFSPSSKWLNKGLHCQKPRLTVYAVHLQPEK